MGGRRVSGVAAAAFVALVVVVVVGVVGVVRAEIVETPLDTADVRHVEAAFGFGSSGPTLTGLAKTLGEFVERTRAFDVDVAATLLGPRFTVRVASTHALRVAGKQRAKNELASWHASLVDELGFEQLVVDEWLWRGDERCVARATMHTHHPRTGKRAAASCTLIATADRDYLDSLVIVVEDALPLLDAAKQPVRVAAERFFAALARRDADALASLFAVDAPLAWRAAPSFAPARREYRGDRVDDVRALLDALASTMRVRRVSRPAFVYERRSSAACGVVVEFEPATSASSKQASIKVQAMFHASNGGGGGGGGNNDGIGNNETLSAATLWFENADDAAFAFDPLLGAPRA